MDIEMVFFKFFLRKVLSTISNSSYTSQIHCRNALRLDPVKPLLPNINSYTKFEENRSKNAQDRERKRSADGRTDGRMDGHSNANF